MRAGHHFPSLVIIFMKKIKRQIAKTFLAKDCTTLFISSWVNVVVAISPLGQYQRNAEGVPSLFFLSQPVTYLVIVYRRAVMYCLIP